MTQPNTQANIALNIDFEKKVTLQGQSQAFTPTPMEGVQRMMFERKGGEKVQRSTSCVQYAPNSHFARHFHPGGEEYLVLSGTFSDETGDYHEGWYVRNAVDSSHRPFSEEGCEIFVKLAQVPPEESSMTLNTHTANWTHVSHQEAQLLLWQSEREITTLHRLVEGNLHQWCFDAPTELFIVQGQIEHQGKPYEARSWLRFPKGVEIEFSTLASTTMYRKIGLGYVRI